MLAQRSTGREGDGTDPWQCICAMTVTFFRAHMLPVLTPVPRKPNFLTIRIRNTLCLRRPHCCVSSIKNNAIECRVCKKPYLEREKKSTTITKIHSALKKKMLFHGPRILFLIFQKNELLFVLLTQQDSWHSGRHCSVIASYQKGAAIIGALHRQQTETQNVLLVLT